eukprot:TRINITY_DN2650_c0_g2_i11.p2 TRINITY_DN2650_c0_g2~~TRINITY_DN2650_c0_g2_i11.p2  ORF type:complete len:107 (+),score=17.96 TRINITY_DN2650_c0_g2_i11:501-821(+)
MRTSRIRHVLLFSDVAVIKRCYEDTKFKHGRKDGPYVLSFRLLNLGEKQLLQGDARLLLLTKGENDEFVIHELEWTYRINQSGRTRQLHFGKFFLSSFWNIKETAD